MEGLITYRPCGQRRHLHSQSANMCYHCPINIDTHSLRTGCPAIPSQLGGYLADTCLPGQRLAYNQTCTVKCPAGYTPASDGTLAYTCSEFGGAFVQQPNATCQPGVYFCGTVPTYWVKYCDFNQFIGDSGIATYLVPHLHSM